MMNKRNILIGIVIIVFGLVFVPRVIDRVKITTFLEVKAEPKAR